MHVPYIVFMDELQELWLLGRAGLTETVSPIGPCGPVLPFISQAQKLELYLYIL